MSFEKLLVILDLDGCLIERFYNIGLKSINNNNKKLGGILIPPYIIYPQIDLHIFINSLLNSKQIKVAIWSSCEQKNVNNILSVLFEQSIINQFEFIWSKTQCDRDFEHQNSWATLKNINKVWQKYPKKWNSKNTIIVDNTLTKVRQYISNVYLMPKFSDAAINNEFSTLLKYIDQKLDILVDENYLKNTEQLAIIMAESVLSTVPLITVKSKKIKKNSQNKLVLLARLRSDKIKTRFNTLINGKKI